MKRIVIVILSILFVTTALFAQRPQTQQREPREPVYKTNLDQLSEEERNEYLLQISRDIIMKVAPDWYRDYGNPEIEKVTSRESQIPSMGRTHYRVFRYYDETVEFFNPAYSTAVNVDEKTGMVTGISFGNGSAWSGLDKPGVLDNIPRRQFNREDHRPRPDIERMRDSLRDRGQRERGGGGRGRQ